MTFPYMPMFWSDYMADTRDLSTEEHGAYLLLIGTYWMTGKPLPNDPERLARICGLPNGRWTDVQRTLERFFTVSSNTWTHNRIEAEIERANDKAEKARKAGKQSAFARKGSKKAPKSTSVQRTLDTRSADVERTYQLEVNQPEPEPDKKEKTPLPPKGGLEPSATDAKPNPHIEALKAFEDYNARALTLGLPQASKLTPDRSRRIQARLRDFGPAGWARALANLDTPFLRGLSSSWRADLDFVCQPKSFARLHDGGYAIAPGATHEANSQRPARILTKHERLQAAVADCLGQNASTDQRSSWAPDIDGDVIASLPRA